MTYGPPGPKNSNVTGNSVRFRSQQPVSCAFTDSDSHLSQRLRVVLKWRTGKRRPAQAQGASHAGSSHRDERGVISKRHPSPSMSFHFREHLPEIDVSSQTWGANGNSMPPYEIKLVAQNCNVRRYLSQRSRHHTARRRHPSRAAYDEWAVSRRYMTLESIAPLSDGVPITLPTVAA